MLQKFEERGFLYHDRKFKQYCHLQSWKVENTPYELGDLRFPVRVLRVPPGFFY